MLMANMFSEDLGSCIPEWKNPIISHGCKCDLLKVRKMEIQREYSGVHV
jgi:hypothetical protein